MSPDRNASVADIGDRHRRRMAWALLTAGMMFALAAAREWVGPGATRDGLAYGVMGLLVVLVVFMAPVVVWKVRNLWGADSTSWDLYRGEDGFIADVLARAHIASWTTTLLVLVVMSAMDGVLEAAPPGFAVQAAIAVLLLSFGIAFLVLDRGEAGA